MNHTPDQAANELHRIASHFRGTRPNISLAGALNLACANNPGLCRAAGLHSSQQKLQFANSAPSPAGVGALTRPQARQRLTRFIESEQKRLGVNYNYDLALRTFANEDPQANAILFGGKPSGPASRNAPAPATPVIPPMTTGQHYSFTCDGRTAAILGLTGQYDPDLVRAAWQSNGQNLDPVDYGAVYAGLKTHIQQQEGLTDAAADAKLRVLQPALAARIDSLKFLAQNNSGDAPAAAAYAASLKKLSSNNP